MTIKKYILAVCFILLYQLVHSQKLTELLQQAEKNHPLLKAKAYEVEAGREKVSAERSSAIPTLDAAYQLNYATYNNITGMAAGQYFVPISGPPSASNEYGGVFGSAGSLLLNWELFTFGQRSSRVQLAKANLDYQEADAAQEVFHHRVKVANAYLDLVMIHELIKVYEKNLKRASENLRIVRSLMGSGLRPGVDTAVFSAEVSRARIELLAHSRLLSGQQIALAELLGTDRLTYAIDSSFFSTLPVLDYDSGAHDHPLIRLSTVRLQVSEQERLSLKRSLNPKLSFWGTAYGRGSGIRYDGYVDSADGLSFSRYNYGMGLIVSVPLLRFVNIQHQLKSYEASMQAQQERLNLVKLQIARQNEVADVTLDHALRMARENPSFYRSANFAYRALLSRYNSGLVNYVDLVQSQYTLLKAEVELKRSYLEAWKALLYKAAVQGDLNVFINQLNR